MDGQCQLITGYPGTRWRADCKISRRSADRASSAADLECILRFLFALQQTIATDRFRQPPLH
jgi:hypothetical protein